MNIQIYYRFSIHIYLTCSILIKGCSSAKHLQKVFLIQERAIRYMKKKQKDKSSKELLEKN